MAKGKKTGGKNWAEGQSGNPGGLRTGARISANDFKDWAFELWRENKDEFRSAILNSDLSKMNFLRMLSGFVPQKIEHTGEDGGGIVINYPDGNYNNKPDTKAS